MDLISKDLVLNREDEENMDEIEEMADPEEFKEESFPDEEENESI